MSDLAHHVNYRRFKGPIPEGLLIRHTCDVPRCVNPDHLIPGTEAENTRDMMERHPEHGPWNSPNRARGERVNTAVLTAEQVVAIRSSSLSKSKLAETYGVTRGAIRKIVTRESWAHV